MMSAPQVESVLGRAVGGMHVLLALQFNKSLRCECLRLSTKPDPQTLAENFSLKLAAATQAFEYQRAHHEQHIRRNP
jgi:hypothetical protein